MIMANFDYESPRTLSEALDLLSSREDAKVLAGGHSLLPAMRLRLASPALLVDIGRIGGLSYIRETGDYIAIGAMTTHFEIANSPTLLRQSPLLALAATQIGDTQVRNRGTIGGSLAQAHPAADYPASILALDADIVASSRSGERVIDAADFFTGMFSTALQPNELLTEVRIPKTTGEGVAYKKHHHPASGFAVVGVAVRLSDSGGKVERVAIGITGVSDHAYRATAVEERLRGKAAKSFAGTTEDVTKGVDVLGDYYASTEYRSHLAAVLTRRALEEASRDRR
jgi:carbon-monoxide dehydrogenase medium subunit